MEALPAGLAPRDPVAVGRQGCEDAILDARESRLVHVTEQLDGEGLAVFADGDAHLEILEGDLVVALDDAVGEGDLPRVGVSVRIPAKLNAQIGSS